MRLVPRYTSLNNSNVNFNLAGKEKNNTFNFWNLHAIIPLAFLFIATLFIEQFALDKSLANWIYHLEGGTWAWRDIWITNDFLHTMGKRTSQFFALLFVLAFVASFFNKKLSSVRLLLAYVLVSSITATLLVSLIKASLAISCPWDFSLFGGQLAYVSVWQQLWLRNGVGCFPAAHASAGYAWLCLYFVGVYKNSKWRWLGLTVALFFGVVFGLGQQVRGAHFISHDVWTLAICWFVALFFYYIFFIAKIKREPSTTKLAIKYRLNNALLFVRKGILTCIFIGPISSVRFAALWSGIFVVFYNFAFFSATNEVYNSFSLMGGLFTVNLALFLWLVTFLIFNLLVIPYLTKAIFICLVLIGASTAYFMQTYGIVIHSLMIQNVFETNVSEAGDLVSVKYIFYMLFLGLLPAVMIAFTRINYDKAVNEIWYKLKLSVMAALLIGLLVFSMSADYSSFIRSHKEIRQRANPLNFVYATLSYFAQSNAPLVVTPIGTDAHLDSSVMLHSKPTLLVLVVGETARADHFSIDGYKRNTTPELAKESIVNFEQIYSCGTETAVSVPCMFSQLTRDDYSDNKGKSQESVLDVMKHAGVPVYWRDNNSSCKGACDRVEYENIQKWQLPELCNSHECFDEALLHQLDIKLNTMQASHSEQVKVIVLHQKGSHGPDYYHRYPTQYEVFKPVCKTNQLSDCSQQELVNSFDNTIRYTDHFLASTINWLKQQSTNYDTAMVYLSDHGESLGENGLFLHGMPYMLAPETQKHVPMFMWFSSSYKYDHGLDETCLRNKTTQTFSQDNLFHTLLSLIKVKSQVYDPDMDMLQGCIS